MLTVFVPGARLPLVENVKVLKFPIYSYIDFDAIRRNQILPETDFLLMQIAEKHYPRTHFKVISRFEFEVDNWREIDFLAYLSESAFDRPYSDPFHKYYRRDRFDFNVAFSLKDNRLFVSGNWREVILTLQYSLSNCSWWDEGEIIPRPYPHGDKLLCVR